MKNAILLLLFVATAFVAKAQLTFKVEKVDASSVPQTVLSAQEQFFPGITVNIWEKQMATAKDKSGDRYVANFQKDDQKTRARYYNNGKGITATSYYLAKELPQEIQNAAAANYPGYTLTSGEQIMWLAQSKSLYRIRLRKGAQKLVVYVDANGKEINRDDVPSEATEDEAAS